MSDEFFFLCATRDDENIISIIVYTVVNLFRVCLRVVCVPFGRCPGVPSSRWSTDRLTRLTSDV